MAEKIVSQFFEAERDPRLIAFDIGLPLPGCRLRDASPLGLRHYVLAQPKSLGQSYLHLVFTRGAILFVLRAPHRELAPRNPDEFHLEAVVVAGLAARVPAKLALASDEGFTPAAADLRPFSRCSRQCTQSIRSWEAYGPAKPSRR